ncbi:hypothetical protein OIE68_45140 [Nocardia vinacea]|uniref:hypothetical protein n=1 Tax=Nocardia vinacea TaxID=96468 RepID=UPI002E1067FB|nr:hypothetical protein OIE68_45140 [Nocardia vinacea]
MRMFDRINRRDIELQLARVVQPLPTDTPITASVLRGIVRQSVRVVADECVLWFESVDEFRVGPRWDLATTCGPLRLPFDSMWIEWAMPERNAEPAPNAGLAVAAWIASEEPPEWAPPGTVQMLTCINFVEVWKGILAYAPSMALVFVDEHGSCLGMDATGNISSEDREALQATVLPGLLAVGLMNCRNVEVSESRDRDRSQRKQRSGTHKPPKPLRHHVITLPGISRPRTSGEVRSAAGGPAPWHLVRGHFKTFTDEAPLMGKHVGTYWWQPTVRGRKEDGVIETSYKVAPPTGSSGPMVTDAWRPE